MGAGGETLLTAACHCGRVRLTLARAPLDITDCNCTMCTALGWRCAHLAEGDLSVEGALDSYVRADLDEVFLTMWRCAHCGIATHWTLIEGGADKRAGVNANLLDPRLVETLPVRAVDGLSW